MKRLSIRWQLTAMYAGLFILTGAAMLAINYTWLDQTIPNVPSRSVIVSSGIGVGKIGPDPANGQYVFGPTTQDITAANNLAKDLRNQTLNQLLLQSGVTLGVMVFIAALLGWLIAGRVVRPVKAMTEQARRLSERNLHERLAMTGPQDEMKDLADTFDAMLGRLDSAFDSQRRFVANASHELRTPLAISRAAVEVQLQRKRPTEAQWRAMADQVLASTARSERLISSLLLLARIEEGRHVREQVDLGQLVRECVEEVRPEAERAALDLEISTEPAIVEGDPDLLRRMIANLLENAARYNVDGGWIRAAVALDNGSATMTIDNPGDQLTSQAAHDLFQPFLRGGSPRTRSADGAGLGLSIVASVAAAHGGTWSAGPRAEGGLSVRIAFYQRVAADGAAASSMRALKPNAQGATS